MNKLESKDSKLINENVFRQQVDIPSFSFNLLMSTLWKIQPEKITGLTTRFGDLIEFKSAWLIKSVSGNCGTVLIGLIRCGLGSAVFGQGSNCNGSGSFIRSSR